MRRSGKITVTYRPMRDGKNGGMFLTTRTSDGTTLTMGGGEKDGGNQGVGPEPVQQIVDLVLE